MKEFDISKYDLTNWNQMIEKYKGRQSLNEFEQMELLNCMINTSNLERGSSEHRKALFKVLSDDLKEVPAVEGHLWTGEWM